MGGDFFFGGSMIAGIVIMAVGAALTYGSNAIVKAIFKAKEPKTDKRSIAIKFAGLAIVIVGMLVVMEIIKF